MSCSEVMYQAYYPYLYQRAAAAGAAGPPVAAHPAVGRAGPFGSPFATAAHQYDRFNVQRLQDAHHAAAASLQQQSGAAAAVLGDAATSALAAHHQLYLQGGGGGPHSSGGSVSSAGGASPASPPSAAGLRGLPGKEEECSLHGRSSAEVETGHGVDDDDSHDGGGGQGGGGGSRAQYVSANCVVFTHYQGEAAAVVDEHFNRALDKTTHAKESSPMSARNFPPSFWNSDAYVGGASSGGHHVAAASDLYSEHYHAATDAAWYHQYSQHHRAVHDYHHHNMAAQYGGLLLPGSAAAARLHMGSHAPCKPMDWQHPSIDSPYSSYPTMSSLEAQVQDSSKDLYWF